MGIWPTDCKRTPRYPKMCTLWWSGWWPSFDLLPATGGFNGICLSCHICFSRNLRKPALCSNIQHLTLPFKPTQTRKNSGKHIGKKNTAGSQPLESLEGDHIHPDRQCWKRWILDIQYVSTDTLSWQFHLQPHHPLQNCTSPAPGYPKQRYQKPLLSQILAQEAAEKNVRYS